MTDQTLADAYNFDDFTRPEYRRMLQLAKATYRFRTFTDFDRSERFVIWWHELDRLPSAARVRAAIEAEEISGCTCFCKLHRGIYRMPKRQVTTWAGDIGEPGADIGRHFDSNSSGI